MFAVPEHGKPPFDFASLHRAWLDCRRGKGQARARWQFEMRLEQNLLDLSAALNARSYRPAPSVCFVSDQPKRREIFAAAFGDRVVHHLLVRQIEPWWERRFIHDSYACRRGKGTLAAVDRLQQFMRQVSGNGSRRAWVLHLDIRSFFVRIDKAILDALLADGLRRQGLPHAADLLWLARTILWCDPADDAVRIGSGFAAVPAHKSLFHTGGRTGLPIGNYSGQFFANVYLDPLDQYVKHTLKCGWYLRYVDDLLLLDHDRERLLGAEIAIESFLRERLALELHAGRRRLAPVSSGVDALGYMVHRTHRLLRRRTVRRLHERLRSATQRMLGQSRGERVLRLREGQAEPLLAMLMSYRGLLRHGQCMRLMADLETRHDWLRWLWRLDHRGRVHRRFRPTQRPGRLAVQWRAFRRAYPGAIVLMQVGSCFEAYGRDAQCLREVLGLPAGRGRPGLRQGAGFRAAPLARARRLARASGRTVVVVRQALGHHGGVRARVVSAIIWPAHGEPPLGDWVVGACEQWRRSRRRTKHTSTEES